MSDFIRGTAEIKLADEPFPILGRLTGEAHGNEERSGSIRVKDVDGAWRDEVFGFMEARKREATLHPMSAHIWDVDVEVGPRRTHAERVALRMGDRRDQHRFQVFVSDESATLSRWRDMPHAIWRVMRDAIREAQGAVEQLRDGSVPMPDERDDRWRLENVTLFKVDVGFEVRVEGAAAMVDTLDDMAARMAAANYRDDGA